MLQVVVKRSVSRSWPKGELNFAHSLLLTDFFRQLSISPVAVRLTVKGVDFAVKLLNKETKR